MKNIYLDFEFRNTTSRDMELICVAYDGHREEDKGSWWLYRQPKNLKQFARATWNLMRDGYRFIGYSEAEARCLIQLWEQYNLEFSFKDFKYIDLMLEYRMILNNWHEYEYGKQYIRGKEIETTPKPLYVEIEPENQDLHHKPEYGLAAACYKMLGVKIDTDHKVDTISLILTKDSYTDEEKIQILKYNESDVVHLKDLYREIMKVLKGRLASTTAGYTRFVGGVFARGEYSARTAQMVRVGYPINEPLLRKFAGISGKILIDAAEEVNKSVEGFKPFLWNKKEGRYVRKEEPIRQWIKAQNIDNWPKTDTGRLSLSSEAFERHYTSESPGFGGSFLRFLKTQRSLNGFLPKRTVGKNQRKTFWDYVGMDGRVRPHFNIYGSQTARSQPAATGFLPLKAHWMRAFIVPPKGRMCVTIDYGQQEFLIAALCSGDERMLQAYESGDPYVYFAKFDGAIPKDGTKKTHAKIRDVYKTTVLSVLFNMGSKGLAHRLSTELQKEYTEEQATRLIQSFYFTFDVFGAWTADQVRTYRHEGRFAKMILPCGWVMWGDQPNWRSVANFPIQGRGSSIMRKAVGFAQDAGLDVIYTLHDALTIECDLNDWAAVDKLAIAMDKGFKHYWPKHLLKRANCRLDVNAWSPELRDEYVIAAQGRKVRTSSLYLDKKGEKDYFKYMSLLG